VHAPAPASPSRAPVIRATAMELAVATTNARVMKAGPVLGAISTSTKLLSSSPNPQTLAARTLAAPTGNAVATDCVSVFRVGAEPSAMLIRAMLTRVAATARAMATAKVSCASAQTDGLAKHAVLTRRQNLTSPHQHPIRRQIRVPVVRARWHAAARLTAHRIRTVALLVTCATRKTHSGGVVKNQANASQVLEATPMTRNSTALRGPAPSKVGRRAQGVSASLLALARGPTQRNVSSRLGHSARVAPKNAVRAAGKGALVVAVRRRKPFKHKRATKSRELSRCAASRPQARPVKTAKSTTKFVLVTLVIRGVVLGCRGLPSQLALSWTFAIPTHVSMAERARRCPFARTEALTRDLDMSVAARVAIPVLTARLVRSALPLMAGIRTVSTPLHPYSWARA